MENTCGNHVWEYGVHSKAWAEEWARNTQAPFLNLTAALAQVRVSLPP